MFSKCALVSLAAYCVAVAHAEDAYCHGDSCYQSQVHGDFKNLADKKADPARFVNISSRQYSTANPQTCFFTMMGGEAVNNWKGIPFRKSAYDLATYPQLMHELQPATIFEIGTFHGGGALWLADLTKITVNRPTPTQLVTLDLHHSMLHPLAKADPNIKPVECDLFKVKECTGLIENLKSQPKPWLVIEDAHVNMAVVLDLLDEYLDVGDYLIVEDTSYDQTAWVRRHGQFANDKTLTDGKLSRDDYKSNEVKTFLEKHASKYAVDSYYQDMYGYNAGKAWNSLLKVVGKD